MPKTSSPSSTATRRRLLLGYAGTCLLAWLLFVLAGTELQRGLWQLWEAAYQATLTLWAPMLLGVAVLPWASWLSGRERALFALLGWHLLAATLFSLTWLALDYSVALLFFGSEHADAMLAQSVLWRAIWGLLAYAATVTGFSGALNARRAKGLAVAAAQAESALARAELSAISGKLNPHFLFNTLNSIIALTRKDAKAAESALLRFSGMLRYVLATKREATERVTLQEELDFLRDYLALEALRLGARLKVEWELEEATLQDEIPPLTLQPLVENSIVHGIAPRTQGGCITISASRDAMTQGLNLCVRDDGQGCDPDRLETASERPGIGLGALRRRFSLDYEGRARLRVHTAPGAGFRVDLWIPQT
ncbi:histidine kinase [Pelomonas sp. SE-A7]|uniref:sensor histidine kinase n=1 Tax=Pelomonas sp. SE-A7 TaxID=3054953 RepID=UPI00259CE240|nr:histidine kinase [Pelomonas sp. SE-A7]MDM4767032.1 histidine kinase [Pelomonas sp. SE-A7]